MGDGLAPAGGAGDIAAVLVYGRGGIHRETWIAGSSLAVGHGAHAGGDGGTLFVPALAFSTMIPMEVEEAKFPFVFEAMEFKPDSGGAGKWRGGMGWYRRYLCLEDCFMISTVERTKEPSWGQRGGRSGSPNRLTVVPPEGEAYDFGKGTSVKLAKGTRVLIEAGGGGGYGPPGERDPAVVLHDLREGYITEARSRIDYPQAFAEAGERA